MGVRLARWGLETYVSEILSCDLRGEQRHRCVQTRVTTSAPLSTYTFQLKSPRNAVFPPPPLPLIVLVSSSRRWRDLLELVRVSRHFLSSPVSEPPKPISKGRKNGMEDGTPERRHIFRATWIYVRDVRIYMAVHIRVVHTLVTLTPRINIPYAPFARGFADCQWRASGTSWTLRKHRARTKRPGRVSTRNLFYSSLRQYRILPHRLYHGE